MAAFPEPSLLARVPLPEDRLERATEALRELRSLEAEYEAVRREAARALKAQGWTLGAIASRMGGIDISRVSRIIRGLN